MTRRHVVAVAAVDDAAVLSAAIRQPTDAKNMTTIVYQINNNQPTWPTDADDFSSNKQQSSNVEPNNT
jgi:hypothetical protein